MQGRFWNDLADKIITNLPVDDLGSLISGEYAESKLKDGLFFSTSNYETLAAASLMTVLITAPATGIYSFMAECECDQPGVLKFSRAPNATATGGTTLVAYNHDGNSANTSALVHVANGTTTSTGTTLQTHVLCAATNNNKAKIGFDESGKAPWRLGASSVHLLQFTADVGSSRTIMRTHFYRDA